MDADLHPPHRNLLSRPELPPEITLFHILPRLPAKSVIRFMCVSKQWHAFLSTPMFKKLHLGHINEDDHHNPNKLLLISATAVPCKFYTFDCEAPEYGLTACASLPLETNPTTIQLSKSDYHHECYKISGRACSLYYDDDYKLLRVTTDSIYIYSLKSDSWRLVGCLEYKLRIPSRLSDHWRPSIWLNEKLYFFREIKFRKCPTVYSIIRFDTKTEKLVEIATPFFKYKRCLESLSFKRIHSLKLRNDRGGDLENG